MGMGILAWLIVGALAGWIASKLTGRGAQMGILGNIAVGIVGAMIGGFIMRIFGGVGVTGFNLWSIMVAVLGACVLLFIVKRANK